MNDKRISEGPTRRSSEAKAYRRTLGESTLGPQGRHSQAVQLSVSNASDNRPPNRSSRRRDPLMIVLT